MVQCDLAWPDGSPVLQSPRTILRRQLDRVADHGWTALAGTELEFIAFDTTYEQAHRDHYRDLTPVNQYNVDYSILGTSRVEPLLRDIRNHMYAAGLDVEGAKGECNLGQHEIGFLFAEALVTADNHAVYKNGREGDRRPSTGRRSRSWRSTTQREGSSCHIHLSLRGTDGELVFWDADTGERTAALRPVRRGCPGHRRGLHAALRARTSTPTSASPTARSRRPRSPGGSTTAPAPCAWSAAAPAPGWRTGSPAPT